MTDLKKPGRAGGTTRGMSLVEMLVATGVGSLVLLSIMTVLVTSNRTFASMGNYVAMEQASRNALDQMTREIRRSKNLISFSTNQLVFNFSGTTNLTYFYDAQSRKLSQWKTGEQTNVLLSGCDSVAFSMYSNIPQPGGVFSNTTVVAQGKSISVAWRCSRTILGKKFDTEDMQQALIVIRNKPVL
jgi:type II secretory pathway pseudopilin PulG